VIWAIEFVFIAIATRLNRSPDRQIDHQITKSPDKITKSPDREITK
jgi:hypothetical protein